MKRKLLNPLFWMLFLMLSLSSCRLGEILSEADPETQAEIDKSEVDPSLEEDPQQ
jgi:hypothetical protein